MVHNRCSGTSVHPLVCGVMASQLVYPMLMGRALAAFGPELYSAANFLALLCLAMLFVALLNLQSNMARPADPVQQRVWRFFRGEGLKRTRSIRQFISSVRGSIKENKYGRLRRGRSPLPSTPLGPNPIAVTNYRSTQKREERRRSSRWAGSGRRLNTSMDEESCSDCLTPNTLSHAITPEPPSGAGEHNLSP